MDARGIFTTDIYYLRMACAPIEGEHKQGKRLQVVVAQRRSNKSLHKFTSWTDLWSKTLFQDVLQMPITNDKSFLAKHKKIYLLYKSVFSSKNMIEADYDESRWSTNEDKEMMKGLAKSRTADYFLDIELAMNC